MERFENPLLTVRALKGAPLSCLLALALLGGGPVGEREIITGTGYSQNKVREGLEVLEAAGLVTRQGRYEGWSLTSGARQLPLTANFFEDGESQKMTLPAVTTATAYIVESQRSVKEQQQENAGESKNDSRASENDKNESQNDSPAIEDFLNECGIMGRTARELARMEHITEAYVRAHVEKGRARGDSIGLIITRMRDGDPAPGGRVVVERHAAGCDCGVCRRKYVSGQFAEFINR